MAYARFRGKQYTKGGWGGNLPPCEVYVWGGIHGLECSACRVLPKVEVTREEFFEKWNEIYAKFGKGPIQRPYFTYQSFVTRSRTEMLKHIRRHRKAGQAVPRHVWRRLVREIRRVGDEY